MEGILKEPPLLPNTVIVNWNTVWEYPKYRVLPKTSGLPETSG